MPFAALKCIEARHSMQRSPPSNAVLSTTSLCTSCASRATAAPAARARRRRAAAAAWAAAGGSTCRRNGSTIEAAAKMRRAIESHSPRFRWRHAEGRVPEVGVVQRVVGDVGALVEQRHRAGGRVAPKEEAREVDVARKAAHDIRHLDRCLPGGTDCTSEDKEEECSDGGAVAAAAARHLHRRRLGRVNRVAHRLGADADARRARSARTRGPPARRCGARARDERGMQAAGGYLRSIACAHRVRSMGNGRRRRGRPICARRILELGRTAPAAIRCASSAARPSSRSSHADTPPATCCCS